MLQITGKTCLTGLLGSPVAHSISPLMHNFSFGKLGINWVYLCFDVKEDGLKEAVQGLRALQVYAVCKRAGNPHGGRNHDASGNGRSCHCYLRPGSA